MATCLYGVVLRESLFRCQLIAVFPQRDAVETLTRGDVEDFAVFPTPKADVGGEFFARERNTSSLASGL
jgi:hypothetical protein